MVEPGTHGSVEETPMMRNPAIPAAVLAIGCQAQFHSEQGQWAFEDPDLVSQPYRGFGDDQSVVEGTPVCGSPHWQGEEIEGWDAAALFAECVEQTLSEGGVFVDEGGRSCVLLEEPGEVAWGLEAAPCEAAFANGEEPVDDRVLFEVVALDDLSAHVDQWPEREALDGLELEPPGLLDETILVAEGEAFRLLEGAEVFLYLRSWDEPRQQPAAWRAGDGAVVVDPTGDVQVLDEDLEPGWVGLILGPGASAELSLEVQGRRLEAGRVQAASPDELASLELVAAFVSHDDAGGRLPWAARAVVLDDDGRPVFGVPVDWSIQGPPMVLEPGPHSGTRFPGGDYAWVEDNCTPPGRQIGERSATLGASYGELSDNLELSWTVTEDMVDLDADWSADERCGGGCGGCASGGGGGGSTWLLGLLGLALGRRRRR
jgi:MYXO-CTERM domain-containing protein